MNCYSEEEYYCHLNNMLQAACQHVRKVFVDRWCEETGKEWVDDAEHVQMFLHEPAGRKVLKRAQTFQKKVLKTKGTDQWDIQLWFLVLQNFGDKDKHKKQNEAIYNLKALRNHLAHHKTKKIGKQEYDKKVEDFKTNMKSLGLVNKEIEELVAKVEQASSLRAAESMARLHKTGEEFLKKGQIDKALDCFSEAVDMPSLLPVDRGAAHEKRSQYWLRLVKNIVTDQDKCDRALLDAKKAMELNDLSWNAHHLAAKCYQHKNKLSQAKHHYERALTILPTQKQVKVDYDSCKVLAGGQEREEHLDPVLMPLNWQEILTQWDQSAEQTHFRNRILGKAIIGQAHVIAGHKFLNGWRVPQNHAKAVECFAKAAAVKNAEGMYYLAHSYYHGVGTKQDIPRALEIYREVATMDPHTKGERTLLKFNIGVAAAEHALGLSYHQGIGVNKDPLKAAQWYQRAMEHGLCHAANNLGSMYLKGDEIPGDEKMAEYCFKQAVDLGAAYAAASLVLLYLKQMEPEKALGMMKIGKQRGHARLLQMPDSVFAAIIESLKQERDELEPELVDFEMAENLTRKGLTFKERLNRKLRHDSRLFEFPEFSFEMDHLISRIMNGVESKDIVNDTAGCSYNFLDWKTVSKVASDDTEEKSVLEVKKYLKSPTRKALVLEHRHKFLEMVSRQARPNLRTGGTMPPKLKQYPPKMASCVKAVTLVEMNSREDHIFEDTAIDLTILDDPNPYLSSIHLLGEDDNGDATRLRIYNVDKSPGNLEYFRAGCKVAILNPYMRVGKLDSSNVIRCDDPRCIVYLEKVNNICRFCGEGNASYKCSKCKRSYCSRECQRLDWKMFEHKLICKTRF